MNARASGEEIVNYLILIGSRPPPQRGASPLLRKAIRPQSQQKVFAWNTQHPIPFEAVGSTVEQVTGCLGIVFCEVLQGCQIA